jgi:hypothetical protein
MANVFICGLSHLSILPFSYMLISARFLQNNRVVSAVRRKKKKM